jgi:hypothetical protein
MWPGAAARESEDEDAEDEVDAERTLVDPFVEEEEEELPGLSAKGPSPEEPRRSNSMTVASKAAAAFRLVPVCGDAGDEGVVVVDPI